jgi:hypothetical protein
MPRKRSVWVRRSGSRFRRVEASNSSAEAPLSLTEVVCRASNLSKNVGYERKKSRTVTSRDRSVLPWCGPLSRSPINWLARSLCVQAEDKLIDFDAGRPGCGHLCKSPVSRLLDAICLNSERTSAPYDVGVFWSPAGFHWPPPSARVLHSQCQRARPSKLAR